MSFRVMLDEHTVREQIKRCDQKISRHQSQVARHTKDKEKWEGILARIQAGESVQMHPGGVVTTHVS